MLDSRGEEMDSALWANIDVHDQAVAFRLALESNFTGHHIFYTMTDNLSVNAMVQELTHRHLPNLSAQIDRLTGKTFYDMTPAYKLLGFTAERTWRQALETTD